MSKGRKPYQYFYKVLLITAYLFLFAVQGNSRQAPTAITEVSSLAYGAEHIPANNIASLNRRQAHPDKRDLHTHFVAAVFDLAPSVPFYKEGRTGQRSVDVPLCFGYHLVPDLRGPPTV